MKIAVLAIALIGAAPVLAQTATDDSKAAEFW
jgi:hypothetical protein